MAKKETDDKGSDRKIDIEMGIISLGGIIDLANKIVDLGTNLRELESRLQQYKAEGKVRSNVDIRVGFLGDKEGTRITSGTFFRHLDELAKERRSQAPSSQGWRATVSTKDLVRTELTADVIEQEDRVYVLTQVPYEEGEIEVRFRKHGEAGELVVEAPKHGFKRLIPISVRVDVPDSGEVRWSYKNHVVEVILPKAKPSGKQP